jgi:hypothetical protein
MDPARLAGCKENAVRRELRQGILTLTVWWLFIRLIPQAVLADF